MDPSPPRFERYVALGDSTTEGLVDLHPDGGLRGWADRLAEQLAAANPGIGYANLAIRGKKLPQIRAEQLEPALALEPDLASVVGGVNDILRPSVDLEARLTDLELMVSALRASGATVLMMTAPEFPFGSERSRARVDPRLRLFSRRLREIADRSGAVIVDVERDGISHPALWASDRLHAAAPGHERMAALAAEALGLAPLDPGWEAALPPAPESSRPRELAAGAVWGARYLAPWIVRRIRGVSSGDGREPKRPALAPVAPPPT